jgi:hypothetical protein
MNSISSRLRRLVIRRAKGRCEYCQLSQDGQEATFHIDHIVPRAAGGTTDETNLALACVSCSLRKEARQSAIDPKSNGTAALFHPRQQGWADHFRWQGATLVGLTPTGRGTVAALRMNRPHILRIRQEEILRGRHPPKES